MSEQKVFAGPRIRRMRNALALTQSAMAKKIGISPSYLNLIERNQRPLTVQILLKLSTEFDLDLGDIRGDQNTMIPPLKEVFGDPLLVGELPSSDELYEVVDAAPNVANAMLKLHRAYLEGQKRLSELKSILEREGHTPALPFAKLPYDELKEEISNRSAYFPFIEKAAEAFGSEIGAGVDMAARLKEWFRVKRGISTDIVSDTVLPNHLRRFDRHAKRLFISDRLSPADQLLHLATEISNHVLRDAISEDLKRLHLSSDEAQRLAFRALARIAAHAVIMPYQSFLRAAKQAKFDLPKLAARFGVNLSHVAVRLTALADAERPGPEFFLKEFDAAGHQTRALGSRGFPEIHFGGQCPKVARHSLKDPPGLIRVSHLQLVDGAEYIALTFSVEPLRLPITEVPIPRIMLLATPLGAASELDIPLPTHKTVVGPDCRVCELPNCTFRAAPAITKQLALDPFSSGIDETDF